MNDTVLNVPYKIHYDFMKRHLSQFPEGYFFRWKEDINGFEILRNDLSVLVVVTLETINEQISAMVERGDKVYTKSEVAKILINFTLVLSCVMMVTGIAVAIHNQHIELMVVGLFVCVAGFILDYFK